MKSTSVEPEPSPPTSRGRPMGGRSRRTSMTDTRNVSGPIKLIEFTEPQ